MVLLDMLYSCYESENQEASALACEVKVCQVYRCENHRECRSQKEMSYQLKLRYPLHANISCT